MTYNRAAIMKDAHKRFRDGKRLGLDWTFGHCLSMAWRAAKGRRKVIYEEHRIAEKPGAKPTLAEAGIDKNLAHRARQIIRDAARRFAAEALSVYAVRR